MSELSVLIPSHNPRRELLAKVLAALRQQSLPLDQWELLLIDNASTPSLSPVVLGWHPQARLVKEPRLGLTHARLRGLNEAKGELLVWVDDDNVLDPGYLEAALEAFRSNPRLGAAGGPSLPCYATPPPVWFVEGLVPLGCSHHGDQPLAMSWRNQPPHYPPAAPIGAGLVIRSEAIRLWADQLEHDPRRQAFGRTGQSLRSGEDNDINLTLLAHGWELAYLPQLRLSHHIPAGRLTEAYQQRLARASFRDFVQVLDLHGVRPWNAIAAWTVPLRALKAWFTFRAWRGPAERIRWQGAIGQFEGRAALARAV
ncbi:MAG: glycosyltransferase [Prochlorococcaceae cyanobacterium]|jgi:glycosyltransferase involved in cell wall biosynthesis